MQKWQYVLGVNMKNYFLDNYLSLHQPPQPTLFIYNEHGSYMYRITHCESTLSTLSKLKTCQAISAFGKRKSKQSFIHLTKVVVLKMTDWARLSFWKWNFILTRFVQLADVFVMSLVTRKASGFVTKVDSNRPVQPQKLGRGLKFRI